MDGENNPDNAIAKFQTDEHAADQRVASDRIEDHGYAHGSGDTPPPHRNNIFLGPEGLRAGWSLLIFMSPFLLLFCIGRVYMHFHPPPHIAHPRLPLPRREIPASQTLFSHGIPAVIFLGLTWMMSRIERRRFGVYGLGGPEPVADLLKGLVTGVVALSVLVGVLSASHLLAFDGLAATGTTVFVHGLKWLAAFCLVGFAEEFMFRGYLQYTLTRGLSGMLPEGNPYRRALGFWLSAILLSLVFFAGHSSNPGESPIGLLAVFLAGMTLAYSLWRTGSLWWAIGFHASWDYMQSYFYGVADSGTMAQGHLLNTHPVGNTLYSGGLTGPEGSVFVIPVLALVCLLIRTTMPQRAQPELMPRDLQSERAEDGRSMSAFPPQG